LLDRLNLIEVYEYIGRRIRPYKGSSRLGKYWLIGIELTLSFGGFRFGREVSMVTKVE